MGITEYLKLSGTNNIRDLDDASTTLLHAVLINRKSILRKIYIDFYYRFKKATSFITGKRLLIELGSGGGFIKDIIPDVITSDVISLPNVDKVFSATKMDFANNIVDAFLMINVLHHIKDAEAFFKEADRCLKIGGIITIIEPANTVWSRFIHRNFHHELFDTEGDWHIKKEGRLSSANTALAWIVFYRDRAQFEKKFLSLRIRKLELHTPFRYVISGGLSMKQLLPTFMYPIIICIENILSPFNRYLGMFLTIELEKIS